MRRLQISLSFVLLLLTVLCVVFAGYSRRLQYQRNLALARQAVADCPGMTQMGDPAKTIRAVNLLMRLTKSDCIAVLRQFHTDEYESVLPILVPVLFPADCQVVPPPEEFFDQCAHQWIFDYAETIVVGGIPFDQHGSYGYSGPPDRNLDDVLAWCDSSGVRRGEPLVPLDNPFEAADLFEASSTEPSESLEYVILICRWQAWSLAPTVSADGASSQPVHCPTLGSGNRPEYLLDDIVWRELRRKGSNLAWRADEMRYVARLDK